MKTGVLFAALIGLSMLLISPAQAEAGGSYGVRNGGGSEAEFIDLQDQITQWLTRSERDGTLDRKLGLSGIGIDSRVFYRHFMKLVDPTSNHPILLMFGTREAVVTDSRGDRYPRICWNERRANQRQIYCNQEKWQSLASDGRLKYVLVFHELLGLLGYETNYRADRGEFSRYPISYRLLAFVSPAADASYELGDEPLGADAPLLASDEPLSDQTVISSDTVQYHLPETPESSSATDDRDVLIIYSAE